MSSNEPSKEFWDRADEVIRLANEQCKSEDIGKVSSSLLYASARFNAFNIASTSEDVDELKNDKDEALKYYCDQYRKMLIENFDDYIDNYAEYFEKDINR